jgi:hypothetical protein
MSFSLEHFDCLPSTQTYLIDRISTENFNLDEAHVVNADRQTAGRGTEVEKYLALKIALEHCEN